MAQDFTTAEFDDMDVAMSQMDSRIFEKDCTTDIAKQMDNEFGKKMMGEEFDETDEAMSQINTEIFDQNIVDAMNLPQELIEQYEAAVDGIDDATIAQMEHEPDVDADPSDIPEELLADYEKALGGILPKKSSDRYIQAYNVFRKWQESHGTESFHEKVLLAYFYVASRKYQPPTLWSIYSMLKKTLIWKHNVDLSKHCQLRAFLKTNADGYHGKQSKVFTPAELHKFFVEAPDSVYLGMKAVAIFGVVGACRGMDLTNMATDFVEDDGEDIKVTLPTTKTKQPKYYVISGEFAKIIREYMKLRSPRTTSNRFFVQFRNGKCVNQVMGKHSIAQVPKNVAKFLQLNEPKKYTGHGFRRTATTIAADAGASLEDLKRLGPWKSTYVCEKYIEQSFEYKRQLGNVITGSINLPSSTKVALNDRTNTRNDFGNEAIPTPADPESFDFSMRHAHNTEKTDPPVHGSEVATVADKESPKMIKIDLNPDKENVIFHFSGTCSNFTIINKK